MIQFKNDFTQPNGNVFVEQVMFKAELYPCCDKLKNYNKYIEPCHQVKFNSIVKSDDSNTVKYNTNKDTVVFTKKGNYRLCWEVYTETPQNICAEFSLIGKQNTDSSYQTLYTVTSDDCGRNIGECILHIQDFDNGASNYQIQLINTTGVKDDNCTCFWKVPNTKCDGETLKYATHCCVMACISVVKLDDSTAGPKGEKGDPGKDGTSYITSGALLRIINKKSELINPGNAFVWNDIICVGDKSNFQLNKKTGSILLKHKGIYSIDWILNVEGAMPPKPDIEADQMSYAVEVKNKKDEIQIYPVTFPMIITGLACGQCLFETEDSVTIRLINYYKDENDKVILSLANHTDIQGSMKITCSYTDDR